MFRNLSKASCGIRHRALLVALVVLAFTIHPAVASGPAQEPTSDLKPSVVRHYAAIVHATYSDALTEARKLEQSIERFLKAPSDDSMQRARQAWIAARKPYLQSEAFRFCDGPIDEVEGFINAWPIDEAIIDYVLEDPTSGVINQPARYPSISRQLLVELNEKTGERSITTGFHAIEFLLWGQDHRTNGCGDRSWKDYTSAVNAARRATYLQSAAQLLVAHLQQVTEQWAPGQTNNYRADFLAIHPDAAIGRILKGMGSLSGPELSGERLTVAYQTKEQEDEHSCFSDTTHLDIQFDALGIENIYVGRYRRVDGSLLVGTGLQKLMSGKDEAAATLMDARVRDCMRAAKAIPAPFDQAILGVDTAPGRMAVRQAAAAFQSLADSIAKTATALGIPLNL